MIPAVSPAATLAVAVSGRSPGSRAGITPLVGAFPCLWHSGISPASISSTVAGAASGLPVLNHWRTDFPFHSVDGGMSVEHLTRMVVNGGESTGMAPAVSRPEIFLLTKQWVAVIRRQPKNYFPCNFNFTYHGTRTKPPRRRCSDDAQLSSDKQSDISGRAHFLMNARISRIVCYINAHYRDPVTQASVAARFRMHPDYLSRRFKIEVGMRFHQYLLWKRLEYAKGLLTNTSSSIKQVGYDSGFSCPETFSKTFRRTIGCSPRAYRNRSGMVCLQPRAADAGHLAEARSARNRRGPLAV